MKQSVNYCLLFTGGFEAEQYVRSEESFPSEIVLFSNIRDIFYL